MQQYECALLHGDMDQADRNRVIMQFKRGDVQIMVATDVAARGLDISHIRTVVNFDIARDIDTHTHRIGRTGRAGEKGTAFTFVTPKDKEFAGHLVRNLEGANQEVPSDLMDLAMQSGWFRKSRFKQGKGKSGGGGGGGAGLGYKERPGLGVQPSFGGGGGSSGVAGSSASSKGPGTDRMSAMKAAFKNQYNNQVGDDNLCGNFKTIIN